VRGWLLGKIESEAKWRNFGKSSLRNKKLGSHFLQKIVNRRLYSTGDEDSLWIVKIFSYLKLGGHLLEFRMKDAIEVRYDQMTEYQFKLPTNDTYENVTLDKEFQYNN
jgi:hypothetical protein